MINRRDFLKHSVLATAAMGAAGISLSAVGANNRVILGIMGCGGRSGSLIDYLMTRDDIEFRCLADPDMRRYEKRAKQVEAGTGKRPACTQDFRRMLDDPEIDGILNATPDHWHALGTIMACQAGKDVFVEKPTSHSVWESRKMIEAARKYDRIVQVGTQNRSAEYCYRAYDYVHSAAFGDVHFVRVLNDKSRKTIYKKPNSPTPPGVDYTMWLGPARKRPFNENHFHYNWHWFWEYSGGDIVNDGVHQLDIARWLADRMLPKAVSSVGGIHFFDDDQETPDTHTVNWEFDGLTMVFEQTLWAPYMQKTPFKFRDTDNLPNWPFSGTRIEVYGTKQMMFLGRHGGGWQVFDADRKSVATCPSNFTRINLGHMNDFIECIRSRKSPNADIVEGHYSTLLCHYGNIAYRTGRRLQINPNTEGFIDDEANALIKRKYRRPWVVPKKV